MTTIITNPFLNISIKGSNNTTIGNGKTTIVSPGDGGDVDSPLDFLIATNTNPWMIHYDGGVEPPTEVPIANLVDTPPVNTGRNVSASDKAIAFVSGNSTTGGRLRVYDRGQAAPHPQVYDDQTNTHSWTQSIGDWVHSLYNADGNNFITVLFLDINNIGSPISFNTTYSSFAKSLAVRPDGNSMTISSAGDPLLIYGIADKNNPILQNQAQPSGTRNSAVYHPSNVEIIVSFGAGTDNIAAYKFDNPFPPVKHPQNKPSGEMLSGVFSEDGTLLLVADDSGNMYAFDSSDADPSNWDLIPGLFPDLINFPPTNMLIKNGVLTTSWGERWIIETSPPSQTKITDFANPSPSPGNAVAYL